MREGSHRPRFGRLCNAIDASGRVYCHHCPRETRTQRGWEESWDEEWSSKGLGQLRNMASEGEEDVRWHNRFTKWGGVQWDWGNWNSAVILKVVLSATDLAHWLHVHANLLLIVVHYCGAAAEFVCTRQCCTVCPLGTVCLGAIERCTIKKSTSLFAVPKAVQWVYRYHYSSWRFQMLGNWLLMKMQLEDQLRIGKGKPKSFGFVQLWCLCWGTYICAESGAKWSVDTKQFV